MMTTGASPSKGGALRPEGRSCRPISPIASATVATRHTGRSAAIAVSCTAWREGRAAVGQHGDVEIPHMRVAHRRGDAAIRHDAGDKEPADVAFAQHPFEPRHVEGRIGDLLDRDIRRLQLLDEPVAPGARLEIALPQKRAQRARDAERSTARPFCRNERELGRHDPPAAGAHEIRRAASAAPAARRSPAPFARRGHRRRRDGGSRSADRQEEQGGARDCGLRAHAARSTIRLPKPIDAGDEIGVDDRRRVRLLENGGPADRRSDRQVRAGRRSRLSCQPPSNQTWRVPRRAFSTGSPGVGRQGGEIEMRAPADRRRAQVHDLRRNAGQQAAERGLVGALESGSHDLGGERDGRRPAAASAAAPPPCGSGRHNACRARTGCRSARPAARPPPRLRKRLTPRSTIRRRAAAVRPGRRAAGSPSAPGRGGCRR